MIELRGIASTIALMRASAELGGPRYAIGSMRCPASAACDETQLGESGQGASRPFATPRFEGRRENAESSANPTIGNSTRPNASKSSHFQFIAKQISFRPRGAALEFR